MSTFFYLEVELHREQEAERWLVSQIPAGHAHVETHFSDPIDNMVRVTVVYE